MRQPCLTERAAWANALIKVIKGQFLMANAATTSPETASPKQEDGFTEILKALLWAGTIAILLRSLLFSPFNIPTGSMISNLLVGDYLFVNKFAYGYSRYSFPFGPPLFNGRIMESQAKRGDVVVFKLPSDNRTDYIKRIVGLPGDQIRMENGMLFVNDGAVTKVRIADKIFNETPNSDCSRDYKYLSYRAVGSDAVAVCRLPQYRETFPVKAGGRSYITTDLLPQGDLDTTSTYIVPAGHYFAMGDNRDDSLDSRVLPNDGGVGYVPAENLVGRAEFRFFSTDGTAKWFNPVSWFSAARWNRFFTAIK
jgi:signal peptidase I